MKSAWRKFYRLSWPDKLLLCRASGYLIAYAAALRLLGLSRTLRLSKRPAASPRPVAGPDPRFEERAGMALDRARKLLRVGTCLSRSLALRRMLAGAGIDAVVRIGTRRDGKRLDAHAWVEPDAARAKLDSGDGPGFRRFSARF